MLYHWNPLRTCWSNNVGGKRKTVQPVIVHDHLDFFNLKCPECGHEVKYRCTDEFYLHDGYECECGATWRIEKGSP